MKIAIVGAGIAGLSAAGGLAARGHEVHVYERQSRREFSRGSFFMVDGHTLERISTVIDEDALFDSSVPIRGTKLADSPAVSNSGLRQFNRVRLLESLLDSSNERGATVHFDACVTGISRASGGVNITIDQSNGEQAYDNVIACDGTFSTVRSHFEPDVAPQYSGQQVLYATTPARTVAATTADDTLVFHSLSDSGVTLGYIYSAVRDETSWFLRVSVEAIPKLSARELVGAAIAKCNAPVATLIAELFNRSNQAVTTCAYNVPLAGRAPQNGTVAIIGDADHAITPAAGSGAKDAFIDAVTVVDGIDAGRVSELLSVRRREIRHHRRSLIARGFPGVIE